MLEPSPFFRSIVRSPSGYEVAEWTAPSCEEEPDWIAPLHVHDACDEAWVVLEGSLVVRAGDEEMRLEAGDAVIAPAGLPHTYRNPDPAPCRYLLMMTGRTKALIDAIHATGDRSPDRMRAIFEEHGARLLA